MRASIRRASPRAPRAAQAADLGVDGLELLERGRVAHAEALDRGLHEPGHARVGEVAGEEPLDGDVISGDERGRGAGAGLARGTRDGERREALGRSGASKVIWGCSVRSSRGAGPAVRWG